jgi:uncharacterized protein (DUF433 family)
MQRSQRIRVNPRQCGGKPCIRGMRVLVQDVLELLQEGMSGEQIVSQLPYLEEEDVRACIEYVGRGNEPMKWWLTTHYPHRSSDHPWHVYVKARYEEKTKKINIGDGIAFYELKDKKGRQAVIKFARVIGGRQKNFNMDGLEERWEWELPCSKFESGKAVEHKQVCKILKRLGTGPMRIPTGVKELREEQFEALRVAAGLKPVSP